jgi:hypothetical protein
MVTANDEVFSRASVFISHYSPDFVYLHFKFY